MKTATVAEMREMDKRMIEEFAVPGEVLMERAGRGVADAVRRLAGAAGIVSPSVLFVAGKGNNGGDAFCAARHLAAAGIRSEVWLACAHDQIQGDALSHLRKMRDANVPLKVMAFADEWTKAEEGWPGRHIVVDGLLGTGISGGARGVVVEAIRFVNRIGRRRLVVAIDVPSGLDADTGESPGESVSADMTVTIGMPKKGFATVHGLERVGNVEVVDIGIPSSLSENVEGGVEITVATDVEGIFGGRRPRAAHKGVFGHALLIGGARGFTGAMTMAARAAVRSGVGLVSVLVPRSLVAGVACSAPEAMVYPAEETSRGSIARSGWAGAIGELTRFDSILLGPGMTACDDTRGIVEDILGGGSGAPVVLDADAINVQKLQDGLTKAARCPVVMTPHPGELARFIEVTPEVVQGDRVGHAERTSEAGGAVVVLKGAGTVVAAPGRRTRVNLTGNPGMASGGMGDVLAGLLAGFLAQGFDSLDAAGASVYLHGRAGDLAALRQCQVGMTAGDVVDCLPTAMKEVCGR